MTRHSPALEVAVTPVRATCLDCDQTRAMNQVGACSVCGSYSIVIQRRGIMDASTACVLHGERLILCPSCEAERMDIIRSRAMRRIDKEIESKGVYEQASDAALRNFVSGVLKEELR